MWITNYACYPPFAALKGQNIVRLKLKEKNTVLLYAE